MPMPVPGTDFDEAEHPAAPENHPLLAAAAAVQWGLDYAWERDTPAQIAQLLRANGAEFACRYVNDPGGKGITAAEAAALHAAGIIVGLVYEVTGADFTGGHAAGAADGGRAAALMRGLGCPAGTMCWFAIDTGTTATAQTSDYLRGCQAGIGSSYAAQLYGSYGVVEAAHAAGLGDKHWQTYAWSAGKVSSRAAVYQYQNGVLVGGISMDRDRTLQPMSGPWAHFGGAPPADWTEEAIMALPTLKQGDRDQAKGSALMVHRVQIGVAGIGRWNNLGAVTAIPDNGNFDAATTAAVKAVQKFFGLTADGVVGPATWRKLIGAL